MELLLFGKVMVGLGLGLGVFGMAITFIKLAFIEIHNEGTFEKILKARELARKIKKMNGNMFIEILKVYKLHFSMRIGQIGFNIFGIGLFALFILLIYKLIF